MPGGLLTCLFQDLVFCSCFLSLQLLTFGCQAFMTLPSQDLLFCLCLLSLPSLLTCPSLHPPPAHSLPPFCSGFDLWTTDPIMPRDSCVLRVCLFHLTSHYAQSLYQSPSLHQHPTSTPSATQFHSFPHFPASLPALPSQTSSQVPDSAPHL